MKCPNCGRKGSGNFCTSCGAPLKKSGKRFWQTGWFAILTLIFFFPVGLYCMWRHTGWKKPVKLAVSALVLVWLIFVGSLGEAADNAESSRPAPAVESAVSAAAQEPEEESSAAEEPAPEPQAEEEPSEEPLLPEAPTEEEEPASSLAEEVPTPQSEAPQQESAAAEPEPEPVPEPAASAAEEPSAAPRQEASAAQSSTSKAETSSDNILYKENYHGHIYRTRSGKCYHYENPCGNGTYYEITWDQIGSLDPCGKCVLH